ncbi:Na+-translocating ferredoxin:NAD+ oxidoreductase RnfA subunit [Halarchaeum rubridurum]|uniref:Na+-translocating ferredoxin:NAD+ oxidoreductase RnfA subunit n=1 Tax=Halarchaeum rubridurum TaxID=489911 RepID=A0A830FTY1_9EURY|nr:hypothetical protein [Halarchaeum rubridurum]MBP1954344.1 Na+-translocating ferredoxin:NAD+ oxidoreductase RnfA subunit [Halarchaeum rubridurum]GGM59330.1 hypothetical protein GCM10009017_06790 [Halarchaeum rubridurum]
MGYRDRLARTLLDESWAYGYTLTIWGAGAFLIAEFGVPTHLDVLGYITGSLVGFAALTWYGFGGLLVRVERDSRDVRSAVEMVHLFATFCNLLGALATIKLADALHAPEPVVFGVVGFGATVGYSLLLVVEECVGEHCLDGDPTRSGTSGSGGAGAGASDGDSDSDGEKS